MEYRLFRSTFKLKLFVSDLPDDFPPDISSSDESDRFSNAQDNHNEDVKENMIEHPSSE